MLLENLVTLHSSDPAPAADAGRFVTAFLSDVERSGGDVAAAASALGAALAGNAAAWQRLYQVVAVSRFDPASPSSVRLQHFLDENADLGERSA
jgi:hypothetical protein